MTTIVSVTDIRKNWTKVAKKVKSGSKVVVMGRSKPLYQITPFENDETVETLTDKESAGIYKSMGQISKGESKTWDPSKEGLDEFLKSWELEKGV